MSIERNNSLIGGQYSRKSFQRLGDDLTEELLKFLSFEDRLRLQCVAKQWRTLIFRKTVTLSVQQFHRLAEAVYNNHLKSLLVKCPNVRELDFGFPSVDDSVLDTLCECCPRLRSIGFDASFVSKEGITRFGHKLGPNMRGIQFNAINANITTEEVLLPLCPNLEELTCNEFLTKDITEVSRFEPMKKLKCQTQSQQSNRVLLRSQPNSTTAQSTGTAVCLVAAGSDQVEGKPGTNA